NTSRSAGSWPASGNRVGAGDAGQMPTITSPSATNITLPAMQTPDTAPSSPPHHYRIQGIHLRKVSESSMSQELMNIGTTGSDGGQNTIAKLPHHFIVDRCWFDGGRSEERRVGKECRAGSP